MPAIINPGQTAMMAAQTNRQNSYDILSADLDYSYPRDLDLRPKSKLHQRLVSEIQQRVLRSYDVMSSKYPVWAELDRTLCPFVDKETRKHLERPKEGVEVNLIYPHSYAILDTMLSYLSAVFFNDPLFRFIGQTGQSMVPAAILELLVQRWVVRNRVPLAIHTIIRSDLVYGFGIGVPEWLDEKNDGRLVSLESYGCNLKALDPYRIFPDPNFQMTEQDKAEYFGWVESKSYFDVLRNEQSNPMFFNGRYLAGMAGYTPTYTANNPSIKNLDGLSRIVWITPMFMQLIPSEFGLSDSDLPELWYFELANEQVIIKAHPIKTRSGKFPIIICADGYDGFNSLPVSRLEAISGLQVVLDWLITSHIRAVRRAVNNRLIVNPDMIEMEDLKNDSPFIRMRRSAFNKDPRLAVQQLAVSDVTARHIADMGIVQDAMRDTAGTDSMAMGMIRTSGPERLTQTEAAGTNQGRQNRFNRISTILQMQLLMPIGEYFGEDTIARFNDDTLMIVPEHYRGLFQDKQQISLKKGDLSTIFGAMGKSVAVDMTVRQSSAEVSNLMSLLKLIMGSELLIRAYNVPSILDEIFIKSGLYNIDRFKMSASIMPDQVVQQGVQNGQYAPA